MSVKKKFERLPKTVKPVLYDLFLQPDLNSFTFYGKEIVSIQVLNPITKLVLNSKKLEIRGASLSSKSIKTILKADCSLHDNDETLTLSFSQEIPVCEAELTIEFDGELNDKMAGFYRAKYISTAGEKDKYFCVTMFAACDARRCFPCWDEPSLKARFDVTLSVDSTFVTLSNMPIDKTEIDENRKKLVKFVRSPVMSSYLLALIVGDFEYIEEMSSDGVIVRVYAPLGKKEQGRFALNAAAKTLPFYKNYFKIAYPLSKIDLVAVSETSVERIIDVLQLCSKIILNTPYIPLLIHTLAIPILVKRNMTDESKWVELQFVFYSLKAVHVYIAAMENWGLITYREDRLLVDENNSSTATKQNVALVVGHELAHQWFGNLVTMEWWTHLWLNEGYASFMEYVCVDHLFPEYDVWTQFLSDVYFFALKLDTLQNSHPIEVPVNHPSEIDEIFDAISYKKGSSIIRMLHRYIGDDDFKKGMTLYLTRHQYSNTCTEDLWAALEEASSKPVKAVMSTWTKQIGYPIVTVECCSINGTTRTVTLSQSKFTSGTNADGDSSHWIIPISFCTKSNPDKEHYTSVMDQKRCTITINNVPPTDWLKLNQGTVGFYRTKYSAEMLQELLPSIEDKTMPSLDRIGILDDVFALVQAGHATTTEALNLITATKNEDNYAVWNSISSFLGKLHALLLDSDCVEAFERFGLSILKPIYKKLGCEKKTNDSHLTILLRSVILRRMVQLGATDFKDIVREKFEKHISEAYILPADERSFIYEAVLAIDGKKAFNKLINLYRKTDLQEEINRILTAFSAITDDNLVDDVLQLIESNKLSSINMECAIGSVALSKVGRNKTFEFFKKNYGAIYNKYKGLFQLPRIVKNVTENFNSEQNAKELEEFFASKDVHGVMRTIQQSLETIRNNVAWLARDETAISNYLQKF